MNAQPIFYWSGVLWGYPRSELRRTFSTQFCLRGKLIFLFLIHISKSTNLRYLLIMI